ncbi:hypothetical protein ILUMI_06553 [Ignelater luminosus]|uniref:Insulin-like domain-containing protein n=1 Tax=Ignelater luminosus TaxID=2038154 RepID=A0A8K0GHM6_IGNLU|nr:hypothetical protein ILUMI_06553 [Ignelater luminosus]
MQPFLPFLLFATLVNVSIQFNLTKEEMQIIKGKFCGRYLSDTLTELCDGEYNRVHKRNMNVNGNEEFQDFSNNADFEDEFLLPFRSKQLAKSIIPARFRKSSHGVASECCHKSCSLWEMYGYCAGKNGR